MLTIPADYVRPVYKDELIQALRLIHHATAPTPDDDGYHENAFEIADEILKRHAEHEAYEEKLAAREKEKFAPSGCPCSEGMFCTPDICPVKSATMSKEQGNG